MQSALLQNSPFTITDDQVDPEAADLLADAIISNSIQRASQPRRSATGDDKRKFDEVDDAIKFANPLKTNHTNHRDSVHSMSSADSNNSGTVLMLLPSKELTLANPLANKAL